MIVATIEIWQDGIDEPVRAFEKEFASEKSMRQWLVAQESNPFLWHILIGFTEVD